MRDKLVRKHFPELEPFLGYTHLPFNPLIPCAYCQRSLDPPGSGTFLAATRDHVIPRSKNKGRPGILVWACHSCNNIKGNRHYEKWRLFMETTPEWWIPRELRRMSLIEATQQIETKEDRRKVSQLKLISGGLDNGGNTPPGNWLEDMKIGTIFSVEGKDPANFMCLTLEVHAKFNRITRLWDHLNDRIFGDVDPKRFVNHFIKLEVLEEPQE